MKAALRSALPAIAAVARHAVRRDPPTPVAMPERPKILLLQLQQIGDSMAVSPLLRALHQRYPDMLLDSLASPAAEAVHRKSPHVHTTTVVRDWRGAYTAARAAHAIRYDCVLACVNQVSFRYALIAALTGARRRIGFDVDGAGFLYTRPLAIPPGMNVLNANLLLAAALDADTSSPAEEFWFDDADRAAAAQLTPGQPYVVMHPGSNWQSKTWYADRWAAVADGLAPLHPVFVGAPADAALVHEIGRGTSLVGKTDLCQLGAVMERAELCITTDSGPRHIAGALGRPLVTVMSSLDEPYRWTFDRPHEIVLRTDPPCAACLLSYCSHRTCMDRLTVDAVLSACARVRRHSQLPTHAA
jgi:heptosyltransferase-1/heptosyltransferase-2